jgi:hypothetical protein
MECGYQKPPFDIHESVRTFMEGHIEYINQQLHSVGHDIVREMRLASFYETNLRFLRCKRRRNAIEWEIELPVRRIGKWEVHELTPIPFKWKNGLCEWKAKEEFIIYRGEEAFVVPRTSSGCIKQKA